MKINKTNSILRGKTRWEILKCRFSRWTDPLLIPLGILGIAIYFFIFICNMDFTTLFLVVPTIIDSFIISFMIIVLLTGFTIDNPMFTSNINLVMILLLWFVAALVLLPTISHIRSIDIPYFLF